MVDKALFIGTSGAKNSMRELEIITNNLANISTTGFREDLQQMKQYQVNEKGQQTRAYSVMDRTYSNFKLGPIIHTDRDLDVAISGNGFLAVQSRTGDEAYTRAGDLQIKNGVLVTQGNNIVLGTSGPINLGNAQKISISADGTVSARMPGGEHNLINVGQIKLVNPPITSLQKGTDGLFHTTGGVTAKQDPSIKIIPGALEGSNVNPVETLTNLIEVSRQFEMHTDLMKTIGDDSSKANEILSLPR